MKVFEFGEYWDTSTFFFFLGLGVIIAHLVKKGAVLNNKVYSDTSNSNRYYFLAFLVFVLTYTMKDLEYGADTMNYYNAWFNTIRFNYVPGVTWEPLYLLFNYLTRLITDDYTIYFFFAAVIISKGYMSFLRRFWKTDCDFGFLILVSLSFAYDMNIMRSAMGMAFVLCSFCALEKKRYSKAFVLSVIGMLFHYTLIINLVFIVFYIFLKNYKRLSVDKLVLFFILTIIITCIFTFLGKNVLAGGRYDRMDHSSPNLLGQWPIFMTGIMALYILLKNKDVNGRVHFAVIASIFSVILLVPYRLLGAYRLLNYYTLPRLLLWDYFIKIFVNNNTVGNRLLKRIIVGCCVIFYALYVMSRRSAYEGFELKFISFL